MQTYLLRTDVAMLSLYGHDVDGDWPKYKYSHRSEVYFRGVVRAAVHRYWAVVGCSRGSSLERYNIISHL